MTRNTSYDRAQDSDDTDYSSDNAQDVSQVQFVMSINNKSIYLPVLAQNPETSQIVTINALLDSGAQGNFITPELTRLLNLKPKTLPRPIPIHNIDRTSNANGAMTQFVEINAMIDQKWFNIRANIAGIGQKSMILGYPFLEQTNPDIDWDKKTFR